MDQIINEHIIKAMIYTGFAGLLAVMSWVIFTTHTHVQDIHSNRLVIEKNGVLIEKNGMAIEKNRTAIEKNGMAINQLEDKVDEILKILHDYDKA